MLSNAYFLAQFRFDTAENEPAKNLQTSAIFPILLTQVKNPRGRRARAEAPRARGPRDARAGGA